MKTSEQPRPLSKQTKLDFASLLKDPSHPEPLKALEHLETGAKPKTAKSIT
jgi:hypothetical protein